jgi:uncharacterized membrane protein YidH (DUF202 family)
MEGGKQAREGDLIVQIDTWIMLGVTGGWMGILLTIVFTVTVVIAYHRYRDHFYALESATDSNKGHTFWTILALVFAILIAVCYFIFY